VWTSVIADDLTGACDVGAALRSLRFRIVIESLDAGADTMGWTDGALVVRNTQSRTLPPEAAAARVRRALADVPSSSDGIVLKKIDTALRGPLGAELDAAMDAVGAALAIVLPAIPEVGRTTVGGRQLIDGIPVHETPFAHDPQNPVRDACVAAVIGATSCRKIAGVSLETVRAGEVRDAVARCRAGGATIIVGDAETDDDLAAWMEGTWDADSGVHAGEVAIPDVLPLVLAGSTGLAKAYRNRSAAGPFGERGRRPALRPETWKGRTGILVVSGSAHPVTREQLAHAGAAIGLEVIAVDLLRPATADDGVVRRLAADRVAALVAPGNDVPGGSAAVLESVASAAAAALERARPRALVLIGGETAFAVLARLGHPRLRIDGPPPAPLAARATIVEGRAAGTVLITKGGSSGPADRLTALVEEAAR
jgi:uncharacterized protein YgbK (DUF1537 family)